MPPRTPLAPVSPNAISAADQAALFARLAAGETDARDALLHAHLGLVHHVARRMSRTLSVRAEFDELVSAGITGLIAAIDAFDPSRGFAFSSFAAPRVRGAMLDELRRLDHVPRSVRARARRIAAARRALTRSLGHPPTTALVAQFLEIDVETLHRWERDADAAQHRSLDEAEPTRASRRGAGSREGRGQGGLVLIDLIAAGDEDGGVEDRVDREQQIALLREAIVALSEQERVVISLYYLEELRMREIATVLEVTESRISQLRAQALRKLRGALLPRIGRAA